MDDIRKWFNNGRKYDDGIKLYLKHGADAQLKRLFTAEGYSDFKMKKLAVALEDLLPGKASAMPIDKNVDKKPDKSPATPVIIPESKWSPQRDAVEQSLYLQWKPLFAEMMNLMARVGDMSRAGINDPAKEQEAGRMALRILDIDDLLDTLYYNRDYYQQHKQLPIEEKPVEIALDHLLWPKKLANHKKYVRTFKNDLKKDPSNVEKAKLLQKHEWAVVKYEQLLKMHHAKME